MDDQNDSNRRNSYWRDNIKLVSILLLIWAWVSLGFGILLRPAVSGIQIGGTDLGFWFAQQGSILCFIALIFFYTWRMNKLDEKYRAGKDDA